MVYKNINNKEDSKGKEEKKEKKKGDSKVKDEL